MSSEPTTHTPLFHPFYTSLHLAEFNIEIGTEITHSITFKDLLEDAQDLPIYVREAIDDTSTAPILHQPGISLMLPDGSHQNIQDAFINMAPVLENAPRTDLDVGSVGSPTPGTPLLVAAAKHVVGTDEEGTNGTPTSAKSANIAPKLGSSHSRRDSTTNSSSANRRRQSTASRVPTKAKLYSLVAYKHMQKMNLKRNARVKSLMLISDTKACVYLKKVLYACLNEIFAIDFLEEGRSEEEKSTMIRDVMRHLYRELCGLHLPTKGDAQDTSTTPQSPLPIPPPRTDALALCYTDTLQKRLHAHLNLQFRGGAYPLKVCTTLPPNILDDPDISLVSLLDTFQEKTMLLFNCILYERKCVLLGHNLAASKVCNYVLAAAAMIPVLPEKHHIRKRVFPYVSFSEMDDFLNTPAYLVGTTNPIFFERNEWYDCLCNLVEGTIQITCPEQLVELSAEDHTFIAQLLHRVNQMRSNPDEYPAARIEQEVQSHFRQYALDIFRGALLMSRGALPTLETFDSAEWQKSKPRIMPKITKSYTFKTHLFQKTRSFRIFKRLLEKQKSALGMNLLEQVMLLRNAKQLEDVEIMEIYGSFLKHVRTHEQVLEFLTYFPAVNGGLDCLFQPLLHPNELMQFTAMSFLSHLEGFKEGEQAISRSNLFLVLTYSKTQTKLSEYTNAVVE